MKKHILWTFIVALSIVGSAGAASARPATTSPRSSADWTGNQACAVVSASDVRCYKTEAEMQQATSRTALSSDATASAMTTTSAYCNGQSGLWVYLYEFSGFGGRVLKFRDVASWQNLSTWSFSDQTTSWVNDTGCAVFAADGDNGGGSWLTLAANSSSSNVGAGWDNRVSSIYING